jgi:LDH2 family malate/lactate/ureidoglycolate dehydrogenase
MPEPASQISSARLREFSAEILAKCGARTSDAALVADSLVQADLWGHQSHGVLRLPWYARRLRSGAMRAEAAPAILVDAGALALVDGQDGIGQAVADFAAREAIERSKRHGVGVVSVRNSNHFGTAMYFTRMAAEAGCVGMLSTNGSPAMPAWGGKTKLVGSNPWSIAAPAGRFPPMLLDIASTAVARGKIYLARNRGEPIPEGWALDADGEPTRDPAAAIAGLIQPMAGHKGYALALMMDVLSGVLSGSRFLTGVHGPYEPQAKSGCGHLFLALDIARIRPLADFQHDMESLIGEIKSAPRRAGVTEIFYPGEIEANNDRRHRRDGLALAPDTLGDLTRMAEAVGSERRPPW